MATFAVRFLLSMALAVAVPGHAAATDDADPPARVGRASLVEGDVAYLRDGQWEPLPLNWPVTTGTRLSAAPGARAEVRIGSTALRLAGATELEFVRLDDDATALRLHHGTIDARVRNREVAQSFSVETLEARATLLEPGRYRFDAGAEPETTAVSAEQGAARVESRGNSLDLRAGKRAEVWRDGDMRLGDMQPDGFDEWALERDRRAEVVQSARYVSPEMTGYESLDDHGDWRELPDYGPVWMPRAVPVGWAPYRAGRWAWVAPWGWTWIDEAPWGFAPFHYGRWALIGGVWGWVPGRVVVRPVYAPALVGWIGRPGWSVTVSIGTVPAVGWFPLAPREVFVPAYRCSTTYVRHVNVAHVTNVAHITNVTRVTNVNYVNRRHDRAVTVAPAAAVTRGQPIARSQVHVRRADLDRNGPASHVPPVQRASRDEERRPRRQFDAPGRPPEARPIQRHEAEMHREQPTRASGPRRPDDRAPGTSPVVRAQPAPAAPVAPNAPTGQPARGAVPSPAAPPVVSPPAAPRPQAGGRAPDRSPAVTPDRADLRARDRSEERIAPMRPEPRREPQRAEPPRAVAPSAPAAAAPQSRSESRPPAPAPVVRTAPPAPPVAMPAPPSPRQPQQSTPRGGDRERGPARGERRGEGRGAG
jgi:hypothetical protein